MKSLFYICSIIFISSVSTIMLTKSAKNTDEVTKSIALTETRNKELLKTKSEAKILLNSFIETQTKIKSNTIVIQQNLNTLKIARKNGNQ